MPGTVLDAGDTVMNKADQSPALKEHMLLIGGGHKVAYVNSAILHLSLTPFRETVHSLTLKHAGWSLFATILLM